VAAPECDTRENLNVVLPQPDRAIGSFSNEREDFDQERLVIRCGVGPGPDPAGPRTQVVIAFGCERCSLGRDFRGEFPKALEVELDRLASGSASSSIDPCDCSLGELPSPA